MQGSKRRVGRPKKETKIEAKASQLPIVAIAPLRCPHCGSSARHSVYGSNLDPFGRMNRYHICGTCKLKFKTREF